MTQLEGLVKSALVRGVLEASVVKARQQCWRNSSVVTLGRAGGLVVKTYSSFRDDAAQTAVARARRIQSMAADGNLFRFVSGTERVSTVCLAESPFAVQAPTPFPFQGQVEFNYEKLFCGYLRLHKVGIPGHGNTILAGLLGMN